MTLTDCPQPTNTGCANHKKFKESTFLSQSKWVTFPGCRNAGWAPHPSSLSALGRRLGESIKCPMTLNTPPHTRPHAHAHTHARTEFTPSSGVLEDQYFPRRVEPPDRGREGAVLTYPPENLHRISH